MSEFEKRAVGKMSLSRRKPVYRKGINDTDYMTTIKVDGKEIMCPIYRRWRGMLRRCYCEKFQEGNLTYKGCEVYAPWLRLSVFAAWMEAQNWEGRELDKDILIEGNKIYSPRRCLFVPKHINSLLIDCGAARGEWPIGVYEDTRRDRFQASIKFQGKKKHLGMFDTPEEAHLAWLEGKAWILRNEAYLLKMEDWRHGTQRDLILANRLEWIARDLELEMETT